MQVIDLNTTIVTVFKMDAIDWHIFHLINFKMDLCKVFNIKQNPETLAVIAGPNGQVLQIENGEVSFESKIFAIDRIVLEDRRIIISMQAESEYIEQVYRTLIEIIHSYTPNNPISLEPIIKTNETVAIIKLDNNINELFRKHCFGNISKLLESQTMNEGIEIHSEVKTLRFLLTYENFPRSYKENNVTLLDKDFLLERRNNTPAEDGIFVSRSPFDTKTHLELLEKIEKIKV